VINRIVDRFFLAKPMHPVLISVRAINSAARSKNQENNRLKSEAAIC